MDRGVGPLQSDQRILEMSRSKDKRRFLVAASCSILTVLLFLRTSCYSAEYVGPTFWAGITQGAVVLGVAPPLANVRGWFHIENYGRDMLWWPVMEANAQYPLLAIPFWLPFVVTAIVSVVSWRRLRAGLPNHCRKCDYDLTGNVSGVCPECGEKVN